MRLENVGPPCTSKRVTLDNTTLTPELGRMKLQAVHGMKPDHQHASSGLWGAVMKPSVCVAIALGVLLSQSANAESVKKDILGVSLGMPYLDVAKPDVIASAGAFQPPQQPLVQVGSYTCKKLGAPWKGSSGELACRVDQQGQLYLDVALLTEPPAIQSITYLFCSREEPSRISERVYQDYGITNGLKELNAVIWGPDYRLDSRTTLTLGYSGHACSAGRGFELRIQDFRLRAQTLKSSQDRAHQTPTKRKS
jgi:hypothetical protein